MNVNINETAPMSIPLLYVSLTVTL